MTTGPLYWTLYEGPDDDHFTLFKYWLINLTGQIQTLSLGYNAPVENSTYVFNVLPNFCWTWWITLELSFRIPSLYTGSDWPFLVSDARFITYSMSSSKLSKAFWQLPEKKTRHDMDLKMSVNGLTWSNEIATLVSYFRVFKCRRMFLIHPSNFRWGFINHKYFWGLVQKKLYQMASNKTTA